MASLAVTLNVDTNCIKIWRFEHAPEKYQQLSTHGGDEDLVVYVPKAMRDYWLPGGLESVVNIDEDDDDPYPAPSYSVYWGHVDRHELDNGDVIVIFAHA